MNRDIWTIVFNDDEELFLLENQIKSLIHFKNTLPYNIIINEFDCTATREKMQLAGMFELLDSAPFETQVYNAEQIVNISELHDSQSYINQQILKLHAHKKSKCAEQVILDAKNVALSYQPIENFHPKRHLPVPNNFYGCYEHFLKRWYPGKQSVPVRPPSTPYLFKKEILEALEADFGSREKYIDALKSFYHPKTKYFKKLDKQVNSKLKVQCISEFFIYNLFEQKHDPNYQELTGPQMHIHWLTSSIDDGKPIDGAYFLSLHRKRVKNLGLRKAQHIIDKKIKEAMVPSDRFELSPSDPQSDVLTTNTN